MKSKGFVVFAVLTASLVGFVAYDFYSGKVKDEKLEKAARLFKFQESQVVELRLQKANDENSIVLKRSGEIWNLEGSVKDLASKDTVTSFLNGLLSEVSLQSITTEQDPATLAKYGLHPAAGTFEVKFSNGEIIQVEIGGQRSFDGNSFIKISDRPGVQKASTVWLNHLEKVNDDFRDRTLLRKPIDRLQKFSVQSTSGASFGFSLNSGRWDFADTRTEWKVDQNRVRELLSILKGPEVANFVWAGEARDKSYNKFLKSKATQKLAAEFLDGSVVTLELYPSSLNSVLLIRDSTQSQIRLAEISVASLQKLFSQTASYFFDRFFPFDFERNKAKLLEVWYKGQRINFKRQKEGWLKSASEVYSTEKVMLFLEKIQQLSADSFLTQDLGNFSKELMWSLVLKDESQQTLFALEVGAKAPSGDLYFAKSSLSSRMFFISAAEIEALKIEEFLSLNGTAK